jgi:hypothetical protein
MDFQDQQQRNQWSVAMDLLKLVFLLTAASCSAQEQWFDALMSYHAQATPTGGSLSIAATNFVIKLHGGTLATRTTNYIASLPAGNLLVVLAACEYDTSQSGINSQLAIGTSRSLTWTKRSACHTTGSCCCEIWSAPDAAGGNLYVTNTWDISSGGGACSSALFSISGSETTPGGYSTNKTGQPVNMSVNVQTTKANSLVFCAAGDWAAANGSGRVYLDTPVVEAGYDYQSGYYTGYYWSKACGSAGVNLLGLSAPTGGTGTSFCGWEVRTP